MIKGKYKQETIKLTADFLGISQIEAEFIYMIEMGLSDGNVIVVLSRPKKGETDERLDRKKELPDRSED